jgi:hypothetical protein
MTCAIFTLSFVSMAAQTSKAQPTPPRPRAAPEVTSVELRPVKTRFGQPCPIDLNFYGAITTNGAATVEYTWVSSDGRSWPTRKINFTAAGTKSVNESWKLGKPGQKVDEWMQIKVLSPNHMLSTKVTESFPCPK